MIESKLMEIYLERCKKEPEFKQELLDAVSKMEGILKDIRMAVHEVEAWKSAHMILTVGTICMN